MANTWSSVLSIAVGVLATVLLMLLAVSDGADAQHFNDKLFYFNQRVDHFDPLNRDTYKQKYYVDDSAYTPGGPVFLFLGGEAPVEFFEFQEVYARQLATEFKALYIAIEHRFYGTSNPKSDYSTDNLKFLSSRQALADAANFLVTYNATLTKGQSKAGPWVVWGCSYSGALSAWFRAKYPNLVVGSVAPSGPVQACNNYTSYYNLFSSVADPKCVNAVQSATNQIISMLKSSSGRSSLKKIFNACDDISENPEENYWFLNQLTSTLGSSDQFQNPTGWPLNATCDTMLASSDYVGNWAKVMDSQQALTRKHQVISTPLACNDYNEQSNWISPMRNVSNANRSWYFQKCTEFGWFKPTYPGTSVFFPSLHLEHRLRWCEQMFGIKGMTPDIDQTNEYYGGFNLKATNVLFTNGLIDPWHLISITKDTGGVQAVTYEAGHCAPMTKPTSQDPPSLVAARTKLRSFVASLVSQA